MATSPAPDAAAPPGMCPGIAVLGGGGGAGGGDGDGNGGKEGEGGGADGNADGAPDPGKYPDCGTASHPVDVVTGRSRTSRPISARAGSARTRSAWTPSATILGVARIPS